MSDKNRIFMPMKKLLYIIGLILLFAANTAAANTDFLGVRVEVVAKGGNVLELTQNGKLFGRFTRGKNLEIIDDIPLYGGNKIELASNTTTSVTGVLDDVNIVARRGVNADGSFNGITAAGAANEGGINILRSPEWGRIQSKYKSILDSGDELGYWKKVTDEFWETVNKPWLDEAITRGDNFRFVSNPTSDVSIYVTRGESLVLE